MLHDSVLLVWPCSPAASDQAVYFKCEFKKNGHCVCPVLFNLPADMSLYLSMSPFFSMTATEVESTKSDVLFCVKAEVHYA